jgi:hypothetical protein
MTERYGKSKELLISVREVACVLPNYHGEGSLKRKGILRTSCTLYCTLQFLINTV